MNSAIPNFTFVGRIVFSPATCPPNEISQSEIRLRNGHVTSESCWLEYELRFDYFSQEMI